jgi:TonB family protein
MRSIRWSALALSIVTISAAGCAGREGARRVFETLHIASSPDSLPLMLNPEPPFRYPADLYARHVQGNVTLHLHVDSLGAVRPESTRIVTRSGYPGLDSAALAGTRALHFRPAMSNGEPLGISILFPVYFRHPGAAPPAIDTTATRAAKR